MNPPSLSASFASFVSIVRDMVFAVAALVLSAMAVAPRLAAAPTFSVPGFVDEQVYLGNGMISLAFDPAGNLLVTEKQGRVLHFRPNTGTTTLSFAYQHF